MENKKYKKWTNEEDLVIISMRKKGKTIREIAAKLGRTEGTVSMRCSKLISECRISKKFGGIPSKLNYKKIGECVSKNPNNIRAAFKKYAEEKGVSWRTVENAYYEKKQPLGKIRVKDMGNWFTVIGKKGHTITNDKNSNNLKSSNLWARLKELLMSSLLS